MLSRKRVLLISYHFPPSNTAGSHRWDLLVQEGVARGWSFHVLHAQIGDHPAVETPEVVTHPIKGRPHVLETLRGRILQMVRPRRSTVVRKPGNGRSERPVVPTEEITHDYSIAGLRRTANAFFYYLPHWEWVKEAVRQGVALARSRQFDLIVCSSPPHLTALAAARIAKVTTLPLVLDFRDPWAAMDVVQAEYASPLFIKITKFLEKRALADASLVVLNTEEARREMNKRNSGVPLVVVRNGSEGSIARHQADTVGRFEMLFAGAIYLDRDPRPLLEAVKVFISSERPSTEEFHLTFVGEVSHFAGIDLRLYVQELGIDAYVSIHAAVPRAELSKLMSQATLLVNLPQSARLCIPSKLYEYFAYPAWVLALEQPGSATANLLAQTDAIVCEPSDRTAIADAIARLFVRFKNGEWPVPIARTSDMSIGTQADTLYAELTRVVQTDGRAL